MGLISNGTTIFDAGALDSGLAKGAMTFIKKLTASGSGTLSFVDGASGVVLDSTYKEYVFTFKNIHPATDGQHLQFQANVAGGADYNETMTTTHFRAVHAEADNDQYLHYHDDPSSFHQSNDNAFQPIATYLGGDTDQASNGILHLFDPSSTTFVKHFTSEFAVSNSNNYIQHHFVAGYFNVTAAIDEIQFKMTSGNIDAGDICLYGIS